MEDTPKSCPFLLAKQKVVSATTSGQSFRNAFVALPMRRAMISEAFLFEAPKAAEGLKPYKVVDAKPLSIM